MNYTEALDYIHKINWTFCKPGLDRTYELCERLGNPQKKLKFIHVAGTNGKGSFCSMLSKVLEEEGYRVGLYTSPYIITFNERMRVNSGNIHDDRLTEITEKVRPHAEAMTDKPTEFELITAIAFQYFYEEKVDVVVLEAGMGGRLDSTNIIENPLLSVITGVALDHTAFLGDTVEKIAAEKAGVIKAGAPVLLGGEDKSVKEVVASVAKEKGSELYTVDYSSLKVKEYSLFGTVLDYKSHKDIKIEFTGLRPGEKLYEEVLANTENTMPTNHSRIRIAKVREYDYEEAKNMTDTLEHLSRIVDVPSMVRLMKQIVPEFISQNSKYEEFDRK